MTTTASTTVRGAAAGLRRHGTGCSHWSRRVLIQFADSGAADVSRARLRARALVVPGACSNVEQLAALVQERNGIPLGDSIHFRAFGSTSIFSNSNATSVPVLEAMVVPRHAAASPPKRRRDSDSLDDVSSVSKASAAKRLRYSSEDDYDSFGYPMSDYEGDSEPLHLKPLDHKEHMVPGWAKTRSVLRDAVEAQLCIDPTSIFGAVPIDGLRCDLREIFGYTPAPSKSKTKSRPAPSSPESMRDDDDDDDDVLLRSPEKNSWKDAMLDEDADADEYTNDDIEMCCVAENSLQKTTSDRDCIAVGTLYLAIMGVNDTFGNLRRHYAKHNHCVETQLDLLLDCPPKPVSALDLKSCPRAMGLFGSAKILIKHAERVVVPVVELGDNTP